MSTCSRCTETAVTHIRYSGQHLCKDHFIRFFEKRAKMEVHRQGKLPRGTVAVALSGGKDSVACLSFLHDLTAHRPDIDLVAVTIDEGIAGYRDTSLEICKELTDCLGVPWKLIGMTELAGYSMDQFAAGEAGRDAAGIERPACGPCGVFRRVGMNRLALEAGAAAIATGHNLDDTAQTVLMNVLNGDAERMARMAPHDDPKDRLVPRILPFRTIPEKEVLLYCLLKGLPVHDEAECPYAERAQRFFLRDKLLELEARSPGTRHSLLRFHDTVKPLVAAEAVGPPLGACETCGEPTSGSVCKACQWRG